MKKSGNVDAYIAGAPKGVRGKLKEFRAAIRKAVPSAKESISYGMPLLWLPRLFGLFRGREAPHRPLYPPADPPKLPQELKKYSTSNSATLRLPLDQKLPLTLIRKLAKARMKYNESKRKPAGSKKTDSSAAST